MNDRFKVLLHFSLLIFNFSFASAANRPAKQQVYEVIATGDKYAKTGDYARALPYYEQAIQEDPNYYLGWFNRGMALNSMGRLDEALSDLNTAVELKPGAVDAHVQKGRTLTALGRYREAVRSFNEAIGLNQNFLRAWLYKGQALEKAGKLGEAHQAYLAATEQNKDYLAGWTSRGRVLIALKKFPEAKKCFERALEINQYSAEAYKGLAAIEIAQGKPKDALKIYEGAIRKLKRDEDAVDELEKLRTELLAVLRPAVLPGKTVIPLIDAPQLPMPGLSEGLSQSESLSRPGSSTINTSTDSYNPDIELQGL